jgi:hypothetical protein
MTGYSRGVELFAKPVPRAAAIPDCMMDAISSKNREHPVELRRNSAPEGDKTRQNITVF